MSELDILLVYAPYNAALMPNLGLASVNAALKSAGFSSAILDLDHRFVQEMDSVVPPERQCLARSYESWIFDTTFAAILAHIEPFVQRSVDAILSTPAHVVGFSVNDFNNNLSSEMIRRLRAAGDTRFIVLGGTNCYLPAHIAQLSRSADAVILGEADESVVEFMHWYEDGTTAPPPGVFLHKDGWKPDAALRAPPRRLEALPPPDYDGQEWPRGWGYREFPILLSRGCIGRCAFCDVAPRDIRFRTRNPRDVLQEIARLRDTYPGLRLHFNDSLVNGSLPALRRLCQLMIDAGLKVPMVGQARARRDMADEDFGLMKRAGFEILLYGIESGSEKVRELMNKTQFASLGEVARSLERTKHSGIRVGVNLIVGFPGETHRELRETADFVLRQRDHIDVIASIACLSILPDTMIWRSPERYGVEPCTKYTPHWRTSDGKNTPEERDRRRSWLYGRLSDAHFEMGPLLNDLAPARGLGSMHPWLRYLRKAWRAAGRFSS